MTSGVSNREVIVIGKSRVVELERRTLSPSDFNAEADVYDIWDGCLKVSACPQFMVRSENLAPLENSSRKELVLAF